MGRPLYSIVLPHDDAPCATRAAPLCIPIRTLRPTSMPAASSLALGCPSTSGGHLASYRFCCASRQNMAASVGLWKAVNHESPSVAER